MLRQAVGVLLAAGAGRRMGRPKALLTDRDGTSWLVRSVEAMQRGGCEPVIVVLGCEHETAAELLHGLDVTVVVAGDWQEGMGASLRAGLQEAKATTARAALVSLVDLPDVGSEVIRRVLREGGDDDVTLARAVYGGIPGHPVLLGRHHWAGVQGSAVGDRGARAYLPHHAVHEVECGDLAKGTDVDRPETLP